MSLDERLRRLAEHVDRELAPTASDLSQHPGRNVVPIRRAGRQSRRPWLVAAVAVAVVGTGLVVSGRWRGDTPPSSAPAPVPAVTEPPVTVAEAVEGAVARPTQPTAFPLVEQEIPGAVGTFGSYSMRGTENAVLVEALVARASPTTLSDGIWIQAMQGTRAEAVAMVTPPDGLPQGQRDPTLLWGREADVYVGQSSPGLITVVVESSLPGVTLMFSGLDPLPTLQSSPWLADARTVAPTDDQAVPPFTLVFAQLPDQYEVVVQPSTVPDGAIVAALSFNNTEEVEGNLVEVSTFDRLVSMAAYETLTAVDVNGVQGWMSEEPGHEITWRVDDGTFALVGGSATIDEAIAAANSVTFVDESTWRERYGVAAPVFPGLQGEGPGVSGP